MRRTIRKNYKLTEKEAEELSEKARKTCRSEAALVRELLNGYEPREKPGDEFYDTMRELSTMADDLQKIAVSFQTVHQAAEAAGAARTEQKAPAEAGTGKSESAGQSEAEIMKPETGKPENEIERQEPEPEAGKPQTEKPELGNPLTVYERLEAEILRWRKFQADIERRFLTPADGISKWQ